MIPKSHEEHQNLITSCINDIHAEFDGIFKVLVEDRSYGTTSRREVQAQAVDLPHIRKLFDSLLNNLKILQSEAAGNNSNSEKKKASKALASNPCGFVNVEEVATVPLRLLRVNSTSNPKQARADKRLYDELIVNHLAELHCLAWKVLGFLFKEVEMGTEVFERELAILVRDQIKSDLKTMDSIGKGSGCALNHFNDLLKSSTSFNGQVFVCELISSGILIEISTKSLKNFASLLRSGPNSETSTKPETAKKARYHQVSESDQKRLETAQNAFTEELENVFLDLLRTFGVFESSQGHLSPQDHVVLSENLLTALALLLQSHHNYHFVPKIVSGEYLRLLVTSLSVALVSFQPAYLPPFLPLSMRLLAGLAGRNDAAGLASRRALIQVELIIHPRRNGPISYRPASEAVKKVFERVEPEPEKQLEEIESEIKVIDNADIKVSGNDAKPLDIDESVNYTATSTVEIPVPHVPPTTVNNVNNFTVNEQSLENPKPLEERRPAPAPTATPIKRPVVQQEEDDDDDDDDDEPMPQIIESGPDDL